MIRQYVYGTGSRVKQSVYLLDTVTMSCVLNSTRNKISWCLHPWTKPCASGTSVVYAKRMSLLVLGLEAHQWGQAQVLLMMIRGQSMADRALLGVRRTRVVCSVVATDWFNVHVYLTRLWLRAKKFTGCTYKGPCRVPQWQLNVTYFLYFAGTTSSRRINKFCDFEIFRTISPDYEFHALSFFHTLELWKSIGFGIGVATYFPRNSSLMELENLNEFLEIKSDTMVRRITGDLCVLLLLYLSSTRIFI